MNSSPFPVVPLHYTWAEGAKVWTTQLDWHAGIFFTLEEGVCGWGHKATSSPY